MSKKQVLSHLDAAEQILFAQLPTNDKKVLLNGGFPILVIRKLIPLRLRHAGLIK